MALPMLATRLHKTVEAVAPISGLSIGTPGVAASVRIDFLPAASPAQRTAAAAAVAAFDWSDAATRTWDDAQHPERTSLRTDATATIAAITTYLALANPNAAQQTAQIRLLSQSVQKILRRLTLVELP